MGPLKIWAFYGGKDLDNSRPIILIYQLLKIRCKHFLTVISFQLCILTGMYFAIFTDIFLNFFFTNMKQLTFVRVNYFELFMFT